MTQDFDLPVSYQGEELLFPLPYKPAGLVINSL
jgi:hypothetical protein